MSILFSSSGQNDLEIINFTTEHISGNDDAYAENSRFMLSKNWELIALERTNDRFYFFTSGKGRKEVDFPRLTANINT